MKKKIAIILVAIFLAMGISACGNKDMWDTVYTFNYAIIKLPNGEVIEGKVESWTDYEDGDQLQIKMENGETYLVHSTNAVLMVNGK